MAQPKPPKKADTKSVLERLPEKAESPSTCRAGIAFPSISWCCSPSPNLANVRTQSFSSSAYPSSVSFPPARPSAYSPRNMVPNDFNPFMNSMKPSARSSSILERNISRVRSRKGMIDRNAFPIRVAVLAAVRRSSRIRSKAGLSELSALFIIWCKVNYIPMGIKIPRTGYFRCDHQTVHQGMSTSGLDRHGHRRPTPRGSDGGCYSSIS